MNLNGFFRASLDVCFSFYDLYVVRFHRGIDAGHQFTYRFVLAGNDFAEVECHIRSIDAVLVTVLGIIVHLCTVE